MTQKLVFRQSDLKTFKRCRRKTWLSVFRGLEPITERPGAQHVGTACHVGLAAYYTHEDPIKAIDAQFESWSRDFPDSDWSDTAALAKIMVTGYIGHVEETGIDARIDFESIEERVEKYLGTFYDYEVYISGVIDLRGTDDLGLRRLYDTKTVTSFSENPVFQIDDQLQTYDWLMDHKFDIATHNRLRRVKRSATAKPPFYDRKEIHFTATQRSNFATQLYGTVQDMMTMYVGIDNPGRVAYPTPTRDCSWDCPFVAVCPMISLGEDAEGLIALSYKEKV